MKNFIFIIIAAVVCCLFACNRGNVSTPSVEEAEEAFSHGQYSQAQTMCDSIALGAPSDALSVGQRCRLALLLMRLAEAYGSADHNTALAANVLDGAFDIAPDSVDAFIDALPFEDKANFALPAAISDARSNPVKLDTLSHAE